MIEKHNLSLEQIAMLPEQLQNPLAILFPNKQNLPELY